MGSAILQGELWGSAADDWANLQEPTGMPLWEAMLDAAHVGSGTKFLDVGCGGGGACLVARQRGAEVSGLDASGALLTIARKRVPTGDFRLGDLDRLPFPASKFDATIAANSIQYAADSALAMRELQRVTAPEGLVVVSVWDTPETCQERFVYLAVRGTQPLAPLGGGPFALSARGALEALFELTGMILVGSGEVDCCFDFPDLESHWRAQRSAGPVQAAIRSAGEGQVRMAVEKAVAPFRTSSGGVRLENRFRYLIAQPGRMI